MTTHITDEQFADAMAAAVAEKGADYVYPDTERMDGGEGICRYVYDGKPSCIIGNALARCGVPVDDLAANEGESAKGVLDGITEGLSEAMISAANAAQNVQDRNSPDYMDGDKMPINTWGEALSSFHRTLSFHRSLYS